MLIIGKIERTMTTMRMRMMAMSAFGALVRQRLLTLEKSRFGFSLFCL